MRFWSSLIASGIIPKTLCFTLRNNFYKQIFSFFCKCLINTFNGRINLKIKLDKFISLLPSLDTIIGYIEKNRNSDRIKNEIAFLKMCIEIYNIYYERLDDIPYDVIYALYYSFIGIWP